MSNTISQVEMERQKKIFIQKLVEIRRKQQSRGQKDTDSKQAKINFSYNSEK